jgi:hypothetical protein
MITLALLPIAIGFGAPENRLGHKMFYNPVKGRVMLYGGADWEDNAHTRTFYDDLWEYDYDSGLWFEVQTTSRPDGRFNTMITYIPERNVLFMYGGYTQNDRVSDTWILDLDIMAWTELEPVDQPSPRSDSSISYDPEHDVVILFSGYRRDEDKTRQTWIYSFEDENWIEVYPENVPLHQYGHYMVYVPETGQHLMYPGHWSVMSGSVTTRHGFGGDIWEYKYPENEWIEYTASSSPSGRYWGNVAYDSDENRIMLFGGHGSRDFDDTWSYDVVDRKWDNISQGDKPSRRSCSSMAYDPMNKVFVLFGGRDSNGDSLADTWIMNSEDMQWVEVVEQHEPVDDNVQEQENLIPGFPVWSIVLSIAIFYLMQEYVR